MLFFLVLWFYVLRYYHLKVLCAAYRITTGFVFIFGYYAMVMVSSQLKLLAGRHKYYVKGYSCPIYFLLIMNYLLRDFVGTYDIHVIHEMLSMKIFRKSTGCGSFISFL